MGRLSYDSSSYFYFFRRISRECGILFSASYPYRFYFFESRHAPQEGAAEVCRHLPDDSEQILRYPRGNVFTYTPHEAMLTRWRAELHYDHLHLLLHSENPYCPYLTRTICYVTSHHHPETCRALTVRKSVKPLPPHRLALRSAPLSTMYPPTTSRLLSGDFSSKSSARTSRKRCLSPTATVTSYIHAMRALVPSHTDLLPPPKRFRDFISPEDSVEEDIDTDVLEEIEADAMAVEVAKDRDVVTGVDAGMVRRSMVGFNVEDEVEDESKRIEDIETDRERWSLRSLIGLMEIELALHNMTITHSGMTSEANEELVSRLVEEALATYEVARGANALEAKSQSQNGSDGDNGNGGNGNGGDGNLNENNRDARHVVRECTYQDFMKCQPLNFKGTEGVVGLTRWFEKRETVFHISNCQENYQFKYATCTLLNSALTWWNSHKRIVGTDAAFIMSWRELMKLMEISRVDYDVHQDGLRGGAGQLAAAWCTIVRFPRSSDPGEARHTDRCDRVEKFIGGLPDNIKYGRQGHYRSDCPKLKDQNRGNKAGNKNRIGEARGKAYMLGRGDANPDSNVVKDVSYAVELADERISKTNTILRGCTLGLLGHPFNIDLMSVELGSVDVIIGMDWLANHHEVIVYDEKIMRIPYGDEVLIVQGDRGGKGENSKLSIISCTKTQKYIKRGCSIFLAQVTKKETGDKSEEKRLEDMPIVHDFSEVFPEQLPGLPPMRQVEFQINLVPGATPVHEPRID
ncbi:putative reverse transcriptase domain-containing protein [Tanacetum coccineum]